MRAPLETALASWAPSINMIIIIIIIIIIIKQCNSTVSRERGLWLDVFLARV